MVIVRHPFGRIASAYQGKFVAHGWDGKPINKDVNRAGFDAKGEDPTDEELEKIPT